MHAWDSEPLTRKELRRVAMALRENSTESLFARIVGGGLSAESLVRLLRHIIFFDWQTKIAGKARMAERLASRAGTSLRTLKYFPEKVEGIADEIERVNRSAVFHPHLVSQPGDALPEALRSYATLVRQRIREREAYLQECRKGWSAEGTEALLFLVQTVREKTRKPQFQKVADLLTKAATMFGVEELYDPDAIKMRVKRKTPRPPSAAAEQG